MFTLNLIFFEFSYEISHVTLSEKVGGKGGHQHQFICRAEDIFTRECLQRLNGDVKVSNGEKVSGSTWAQSLAGAVEVGSVSSGLAQASLVCLMCHYERLAPGAGLQLSHSIISEADSQTHTAHTHCINYRQLKRPGCDVPAPLPVCHMSGVCVCMCMCFKSCIYVCLV